MRKLHIVSKRREHTIYGGAEFKILRQQNAEFFCNHFVSFNFSLKKEKNGAVQVYKDYGIIHTAIACFRQ